MTVEKLLEQLEYEERKLEDEALFCKARVYEIRAFLDGRESDDDYLELWNLKARVAEEERRNIQLAIEIIKERVS